MDDNALANPSAAGAAARSIAARWSAALRRMFRNRLFAIGVLILLPLVIMAVGVSSLTGHDPTTMNTANKLQPPSLDHPFGTDEFGRDLFARVLHGSRISLRVAAAATIVMAGLGIVLGCLAGFYRSADAVISRIGDALLNFPGLIIGIMVMAALGQSERNVVLSMVIMYTPRIVRVVRASVI